MERATLATAPVDAPESATGGCLRLRGGAPQGMWMPEMARAMMSRWISEVPSKMV